MRRAGILSVYHGLLPTIIMLSLCLWGGMASPRAEETPGLKLKIAPVRDIFSPREALATTLIFTARARTKLCLEKDPMSQMRFSIVRSGTGLLPLRPLVIRDNRPLFKQPMNVRWLAPGERFPLKINLKRLQFDGDERWTPGEYGVNVTFQLCEQTPDESVTEPGRETAIPSNQARFLIAL